MTANALIATIMQLAGEIYRQEIYLNADSGEILRRELTEQGSIYYPIAFDTEGKNPAPYLYLNENNLLTSSEVYKSEKIGNNRKNIGLKSDEIRITIRNENENHSEQNQKINGQKPENKRIKNGTLSEKKRSQIFHYHNLMTVSNQYSGELQARILTIEELTAELLNNTNKQSTIDGIIKLFNRSTLLANNQNIYELNKIIKTLQGKLKQQLTMLQVNEKQKKKKIFTDKIKIYGTVIIVGLGLIVALYFNIKKHLYNGNNPIYSNTDIEVKQTKIYTKTEITALINDYEKLHNVKIYKWRRSKIIEAFPDKKITKVQALAIINRVAFYNFAKKNQIHKKQHQHRQNNSNIMIGYDPNLANNGNTR